MALAEKLTLSAEDYLHGEVWAKVGASDVYVSIVMKLALLLQQAVKDTPCRAYISDMKVNVTIANAFFYPDALLDVADQV